MLQCCHTSLQRAFATFSQLFRYIYTNCFLFHSIQIASIESITENRQIKKNKMGKFSGKKCRLLSVMILTVFFFFVEIIVGYVTNSMALVADSFHMLGDIAALLISFMSIKVNASIETFSPIRLKFTHFPARCRQRNGPKIHSDGPEPRYWVHWSMLCFQWLSASVLPSRPANGE